MADQQQTPQSWYSNLFDPITQSVQSKLPTKEEAIQGYLGAVLAFWVIGGITLLVVAAIYRRNRK